ncbi:unnamed protein product [Ectocarpus sp. 12 AP-2014]
MPTSLGEWADLDTDRLWSLPLSLPLPVSAAGRRQRSTASFDDTEALALRALWEAMSGGGGAITADSLFAFDDSFGEGTDCLHAAAVLRALAPSGRREAHACEPAMMGDFLRVAGALKEMSSVGNSPENASGRSTEIDVIVESSSENAVVERSSPENAIVGKSPESAIVGNCSPETAVGNSPNAAMSLGDGTPPDSPETVIATPRWNRRLGRNPMHASISPGSLSVGDSCGRDQGLGSSPKEMSLSDYPDDPLRASLDWDWGVIAPPDGSDPKTPYVSTESTSSSSTRTTSTSSSGSSSGRSSRRRRRGSSSKKPRRRKGKSSSPRTQATTASPKESAVAVAAPAPTTRRVSAASYVTQLGLALQQLGCPM